MYYLKIKHHSSPDFDALLVDIVRCELCDVGSIERNSPALLDVGHDLPIGYLFQVAGLQVLGEHRLGDLSGQPVLGAQGPVVKINGLRHIVIAIVPPEPPHLGNGTAPPQPATRDLNDGFHDLQGHELLEDAVGGGLGHPELDLEQPGGGGPVPA